MNAPRLTEGARHEIERECARLIAAYAFLVDRRRYAEMIPLFAENCVFERPGVRAEGHAALRAFLEGRPRNIATRHLCGAPFFESVSAEEALTVTYMTIFHGDGEDEGPIDVPGVAGLGEFHDIFRPTPAGWRIWKRVARPVMIVRPQPDN